MKINTLINLKKYNANLIAKKGEKMKIKKLMLLCSCFVALMSGDYQTNTAIEEETKTIITEFIGLHPATDWGFVKLKLANKVISKEVELKDIDNIINAQKKAVEAQQKAIDIKINQMKLQVKNLSLSDPRRKIKQAELEAFIAKNNVNIIKTTQTIKKLDNLQNDMHATINSMLVSKKLFEGIF